jgi:hypothetical protein
MDNPSPVAHLEILESTELIYDSNLDVAPGFGGHFINVITW